MDRKYPNALEYIKIEAVIWVKQKFWAVKIWAKMIWKQPSSFRPLGKDALMMISGLISYRIMGYKLIKPLHDNTCQIDYGHMCI